MNNLTNLPHPADKILAEFIARIVPVIPQLEGIYVTGSVALGDYYSAKSDIDFIAVLDKLPDAEAFQKIEKIHIAIERKFNNPALNGYYSSVEGLKGGRLTFPSFFKGRMILDRPFELDQFALFELMTSSIHVYGKPAAELDIEVSLRNVLHQLHQNINGYWKSWIDKHSQFRPGYFLLVLFPRLTEWGVLGVTRQLYTLETQKITSKYGAGRYYLDRLPGAYRDILLTAISVRKINGTQLRPSPGRAERTLRCMKFMIGEFNRRYEELRT